MRTRRIRRWTQIARARAMADGRMAGAANESAGSAESADVEEDAVMRVHHCIALKPHRRYGTLRGQWSTLDIGVPIRATAICSPTLITLTRGTAPAVPASQYS